mmetsp:Transcript_138009/g.440826  ORF Transcript_138009/g.440826 Transcript_138009/m.440826 type:complete len:366 (-) Transcript_138009:81-1178(-)
MQKYRELGIAQSNIAAIVDIRNVLEAWRLRQLHGGATHVDGAQPLQTLHELGGRRGHRRGRRPLLRRRRLRLRRRGAALVDQQPQAEAAHLWRPLVAQHLPEPLPQPAEVLPAVRHDDIDDGQRKRPEGGILSGQGSAAAGHLQRGVKAPPGGLDGLQAVDVAGQLLRCLVHAHPVVDHRGVLAKLEQHRDRYHKGQVLCIEERGQHDHATTLQLHQTASAEDTGFVAFRDPGQQNGHPDVVHGRRAPTGIKLQRTLLEDRAVEDPLQLLVSDARPLEPRLGGPRPQALADAADGLAVEADATDHVGSHPGLVPNRKTRASDTPPWLRFQQAAGGGGGQHRRLRGSCGYGPKLCAKRQQRQRQRS